MKTKAEVRTFLDGKVGTIVVDESKASLNGQCVALIKSLMDFLGVPNPYAARGDAKTAGDAYIAQGIGKSGSGWLTICVDKNNGTETGHIWIDLANEANYESNGRTALRVTKNTRPVQQAEQFVNFDKWISESIIDDMAEKINLDTARIITHGVLARNGLAGRPTSLDGSQDSDLQANHVGKELTNKYVQGLFLSQEARDWRDIDTDQSIPGINRRLATPKIVEKIVEKPVEKIVIKEVPVEVVKEMPFDESKLSLGYILRVLWVKLTKR